MEEISLVLQLILQLLPILKPDEITQIRKELDKMEKEWDEDVQKTLKALEAEPTDFDALNTILAKYLPLL